MGSLRLCAIALLLAAACCQPALGRDFLRLKRSSHYCGSELATMLELVCGVGGGGSVGKRAGVSGSMRTATGNMADYNVDQRPNQLESLVQALQYPSYGGRPPLVESVDPFGGRRRESRSAPGGSNHVRVKRQGIVDECCYNPCSMIVLRSYCES